MWTTLLRVDSEQRNKRPLLFYGAPAFLFVFLSIVNAIFGKSWFWTMIAYMAIYHFTRQHYGLVCLYKSRAGERSQLDFQLDWIASMTAAWIPVLQMHATATGKFSWFNNGEEFLIRLPEAATPFLWMWYGVIAFLWLLRFCRVASGGSPNWGKLWVMLGAWVTWYIGGSCNHEVLSLAFINLIHGISTIVLVYHVSQRRFGDWEKKAPDTMDAMDRLGAMLSRPGRWPLYMLFIISIAAVEELLWDSLVYHMYLPHDRLVYMNPFWHTFAPPLLALPQVTHYYLDAFLWKFDGSNPGLKEAFMPVLASRVKSE